MPRPLRVPTMEAGKPARRDAAGARRKAEPTVRYQEILRRLAIVDEGFVGDQAGLVLGWPAAGVLDVKTAALVRVGVLAAIGAPEACLEWGSSQALAAGATEAEITGVLLAIAPVIGLGQVVGAAPGVAGAFGYDIEAALEDPGDI
jgi:4-carboxymuconolactone decarboxylase